MTWQPMTTAPQDGTAVLLAVYSNHYGGPPVGHYVIGVCVIHPVTLEAIWFDQAHEVRTANAPARWCALPKIYEAAFSGEVP